MTTRLSISRPCNIFHLMSFHSHTLQRPWTQVTTLDMLRLFHHTTHVTQWKTNEQVQAIVTKCIRPTYCLRNQYCISKYKYKKGTQIAENIINELCCSYRRCSVFFGLVPVSNMVQYIFQRWWGGGSKQLAPHVLMEKYTSFWLLQFLNFFTYFHSRLPDGLLIPEKEVLCYIKGNHASDDLCSYSLVTNSMV